MKSVDERRRMGVCEEVDKTEVQKKCSRAPVLEIVGARHEKQSQK